MKDRVTFKICAVLCVFSLGGILWKFSAENAPQMSKDSIEVLLFVALFSFSIGGFVFGGMGKTEDGP